MNQMSTENTFFPLSSEMITSVFDIDLLGNTWHQRMSRIVDSMDLWVLLKIKLALFIFEFQFGAYGNYFRTELSKNNFTNTSLPPPLFAYLFKLVAREIFANLTVTKLISKIAKDSENFPRSEIIEDIRNWTSRMF